MLVTFRQQIAILNVLKEVEPVWYLNHVHKIVNENGCVTLTTSDCTIKIDEADILSICQ